MDDSELSGPQEYAESDRKTFIPVQWLRVRDYDTLNDGNIIHLNLISAQLLKIILTEFIVPVFHLQVENCIGSGSFLSES